MAFEALPVVTVATLIPLGLFYATLALVGTVEVAIIVLLAWSCLAFAAHYFRHGRVPGVLTLTLFGTILRVAMSFAAGSTFVYFVVPILGTLVFGMVFLTSLFHGEPLIVRLARDFVPSLVDDLADHRQLVVWLSLVWALVYLASGTTALTLLTTQPTTVYVGVHVVAGWGWVAAGIAVSAVVCRRMAKGLMVETPVLVTAA